MKRFSFSLQKLLSLREFREQEAEIELGRANAKREAVVIDLEDTAKKRVAASFERQGALPLQDLIAIERFINRLDIKKEKLLNDLAAAELVVERMREKFLAASRDRKVITKLREKKEAVWHKEALDDEAAILDDIANFRDRNK